jgi:tryprostatin B 6-hydroxylase
LLLLFWIAKVKMAVLDISLPQAALVGTIAGLSSHWLYFNRGEHHLRAGRLFVLAVSSPFLVYLALQNTTTGLTTSQLKLLSAAAVSSFFTALWGSIVTYRLFFHRLNGFPGPKPLRVSKLVHTWRLYTRRDNYKQLHEMHEEFGDFVRTGTCTKT